MVRGRLTPRYPEAPGSIAPRSPGRFRVRPHTAVDTGAARQDTESSGKGAGGEGHGVVRFEVKAGSGGEYSWWLVASNGQTVAWAGESFASKSNATRAAKAFGAGAAEAEYELYEDRGGNWRWRAHRGNNIVAVPGEAFASKSNAKRAADNVRDRAGGATGP